MTTPGHNQDLAKGLIKVFANARSAKKLWVTQ